MPNNELKKYNLLIILLIITNCAWAAFLVYYIKDSYQKIYYFEQQVSAVEFSLQQAHDSFFTGMHIEEAIKKIPVAGKNNAESKILTYQNNGRNYKMFYDNKGIIWKVEMTRTLLKIDRERNAFVTLSKNIATYLPYVVILIVLSLILYFSKNTWRRTLQIVIWWPAVFWLILLYNTSITDKYLANFFNYFYLGYGVIPFFYYLIIELIRRKTKMGTYISKREMTISVIIVFVIVLTLHILALMFSGFAMQGAGK